MAPPGRQKSECEFCLFGGVLFVRRAAPYGRLAVLARPAAVAAACVPDISAGAPLPCSRPSGRLSLFARPVLPEPARHALCVRSSVLFWLSVCLFCVVCTRIFLLSFTFSCLPFASQISFHLSLRPRRASTFFRKESRQRFAKGLRPFEPHSCALRPIFFSSALLAGLAALLAANRRLTGKRLKSQGAELSFSSVSVQRGTPAPFR